MDFQELIEVLRGRLWLIVSVVVLSVVTAGAITLMTPNTYTATTTLIIDVKTPDLFGNSTMPIQLVSSYMATQRDVLMSPRVAKRAAVLMAPDKDPAMQEAFALSGGAGPIEWWLAWQLMNGLEIVPSRDSSLVYVNFYSTDATFAAKAANAIADAYIETNLELSIEPAKQGTAWLDSQLKVLRSKAEESQRALAQYQQERGIVVTDERVDTELSKLSTLSKSVIDAEAEAADLGQRAQQTAELLKAGVLEAESIPEVVANTFIQNLKTEILRQQAKLSELSNSLGANHPQYLAAKGELESLKAKLVSEIRTVAAGLTNQARLARERADALARTLAQQKSSILDLRRQRDELNVLVKEAENAQRTYEAALQRYSEVTLQSQVNQTNVVKLNEATVPVIPSSPNMKLNIALAAFSGLVVALAVALLAELLDRRVRSRRVLMSHLRAPLLGTVGRAE